MKLGIKVGPQTQSIHNLEVTNPAACEVWYNATRPNEYDELFAALHKRQIEVGLHFWGTLPDGTMTNIAYPDHSLSKTSVDLIEQTIDVASKLGYAYVNIHPGGLSRVMADFDNMNYPAISAPCDDSQAQEQFLENVGALHRYAQDRGIVLTVETVCLYCPKNNWYQPDARLVPINLYELSPQAIKRAAQVGVSVANDFAHTGTHCVSDDPGKIWQYLQSLTQALAPATRLIHLGFLVPPYNGVDNHDMLNNPLLDTNQAIPNRAQMIELLKLFKDRSDVWIITEPRADHVKNYFLAQKILTEALT